jgi:RNA polymerase sigma factor (sigma-70 family)
VEVVTDKPSSAAVDLVTAAVQGDRDAFRRLVEPLLPTALGAATVLLRSRSEAEDVLQDALLSAWRDLERLRDPVAFPAWFRRHVIRGAMRRASRRRSLVELDIDAPAPPGELEAALERRALRRAFATLEADDRALLTLRYLWDVSVAETAEALSIPEGTVKSRVHGAMDRLRAAYAAEERR